ncbi:MAG: DNA polymerase III subunit gamma/tau [Deltaproteobacteria bacterium]|nr:DNA polymerase III subunit gamma/tau [Deltaproteobacteria bacterium]
MSYLVLARKYRPQTFDDVVQQDHVTRTIANAIASERVAHAILFTGPRGTGKTTIARILAKAMNCEKGPTQTPCNACRSCREITGGSGADVYEIDGASNNGVDQIRELRGNIKYMPAHSRFKIYIIDEVHMLSTPAFNALLKTLEEPPPHIMFLMATTEPQKIPVTILSRCQRHDLKRMDGDAIAGHMAAICRSEGIDTAPKALDRIAEQAGGSMRDALSLLDQVISGVSGPVSLEAVNDILGVVDRQSITDIAEAILNRDLTSVLEIVAGVYAFGHSIPEFHAALIRYFRDLAVIKLVAAPNRVLDLPEKEIRSMQARVQKVSSLHINQILEMLFKAEKEIRWSTNPKMAFEIEMIRLHEVTPLLPIGDLIEKLDELRKTVGPVTGQLPPAGRAPGAPVRQAAAQTPETPVENRSESGADTDKKPPGDTPAAVSMTTEAGRERAWEKMLDAIGERHPSMAANLTNSRLVDCREDPDAVRLEIEVNGSRFNFNRINRKDSLKDLEAACGACLGRRVALSVRMGRHRDEQKKKRKKDEADRLKREVLDHPLVADAIEIFNGKLVDVKVDA